MHLQQIVCVCVQYVHTVHVLRIYLVQIGYIACITETVCCSKIE